MCINKVIMEKFYKPMGLFSILVIKAHGLIKFYHIFDNKYFANENSIPCLPPQQVIHNRNDYKIIIDSK